MRERTVWGTNAAGERVAIKRLIPENDADRAEIQRLANAGKVDSRTLADGPARR